jgi:hypothetical protein
MAKIFLSYRRADSATISGRIYDRLVAKFGARNIFKDVDNIPPGVDFADYTRSILRQSDVALVIIGRQWLDGPGTEVPGRPGGPSDWVRFEVESALASNVPIIPVLVDGATMPVAADLPESLQQLARINAVQVRNDPDFARDMERLVVALERAFASKPRSPIFKRRSDPLQSSPRTPSQDLPDATPVAPKGSPETAVGSDSAGALVDRGVAETAAASKRGRFGLGALTRSRPVVGGLALLLVVLAFAVLFSQGLRYLQTNSASATQTAHTGAIAAQTQTAETAAVGTAAVISTQTATAKLISFPYTAAAPGPQCDIGKAAWATADGSDPSLSVTCFPDHTTLSHSPHICESQGCHGGYGYMYWTIDALVAQLPASYTVSVQMSNLRSSAAVKLAVVTVNGSTQVGYGIELDGNNYYSVGWGRTSGSEPPNFEGFLTSAPDAPLDASRPHKVALSFSGAKVTALLDDHVVGSRTEQASITTKEFALEISQVANGGFPTADLSNFSITPS